MVRAQVDARMMRNPDVSKTQIVFTYGGDLWVVPKQGGTALKLSSSPGQELFAKFSPDGSEIAYSATYRGNVDVYVIPASGGAPTRVTHHGMSDRLIDWYPDGKSLLYASSMASGRQRFNQFYKVGKSGGLPEKLPIPYGETASLSPDGTKIAYTPVSQAFRTWKRYRGGWQADIWIYDLLKNTAGNINNNPSDDEFPMWSGNKIYYLSDSGPDLRTNIWSCDLAAKKHKQITKFTDFDIHFPSLGPSDIVFEEGGRLHLLSLADEKYREVEVKLVTDEITLMPKVEKVAGLIQNSGLSPDGTGAVIEARGEIFSIPAENGPLYNLTQSAGVAERYPAWSPDGKYVAYWSDRSGEYELTIRDMEKPAGEKKLTSYGPGYRYQLFWSPDSKKIAFVDNAMGIFVLDPGTGKTTKVDKGLSLFAAALEGFSVSWSSDSRWMAYARGLETRRSAIFIYDLKENRLHQVTSGYNNDANPVFDPDGKYLYFVTNRTYNPLYSDIQYAFFYANSTNVAAVPLTEDIASPLAPKNDMPAVTKDEPKKEETAAKKDEKAEKDAKEVKITLENFESRLVILPAAPGNYGALAAVSGKVIYHRQPNTGAAAPIRPIVLYDLEKQEEKTIIEDAELFKISADGKKMLVGNNGAFSVMDIAPGQKMTKMMPTAQLEMTIDPRAEWKQIFNDVWRFERDYFYDPNMHGIDWKAVGERYRKLIDACVTRWDVSYLIGELIGELSSSHTFNSGGDTDEATPRNVGYLGIDWEIAEGAYRIKKIIGGAPWDSDVRSPLRMPGLKVKEGDYIMAVNGELLDLRQDPWAAFEGLAGRTVELTINGKPGFDGARKIVVKTLGDETRLRYLAWIEANRKRVEDATKGKIGYIYVLNTGTDGLSELIRQLAAQHKKDGLIIDERFNGGGQIPYRFIELLDRKPLAFWAVRDSMTWQVPPVANFGPKVMLINGWSGSGGDAFPDFFRKENLGPLVGMRTWGGLIGISGSPSLIDGGAVTVPTDRMYDPDGKWFKEGHGVDPDIEVIDDPSQLAKGIDPQLERGIQEILRLLEKNPPVNPKRPAYEKR
jgi:tricorn protease